MFVVLIYHQWVLLTSGGYVVMRSLGLHSQPLLTFVPDGAAASLLADLYLHGESLAGVQRCAAQRGFVLTYAAILHWSRCHAPVRIVTMEQVESDADLLCNLRLLLARHLAR